MNKFEIIDEPFKGLKVLKNTPNIDNRGFFQRLWCNNDFEELGLKKDIVNINHSLTKEKGTIRGLHFQYSPATETKIIKCIRGSISDVVVDIRKDSPTFLKSFTIELNESNNLMLFIPEGFAHGFQSLENNCEIIYFVSSFYSKDLESGLNPFDHKLNINWPQECSFISKQDKNRLMIDENFLGI